MLVGSFTVVTSFYAFTVTRVLPHLLRSRAIIHHAVLCCHGRGIMQSADIKGNVIDLGNVVGDVGNAHPLCGILVPPILEKLFEEWSLSRLGKNLYLQR